MPARISGDSIGSDLEGYWRPTSTAKPGFPFWLAGHHRFYTQTASSRHLSPLCAALSDFGSLSY